MVGYVLAVHMNKNGPTDSWHREMTDFARQWKDNAVSLGLDPSYLYKTFTFKVPGLDTLELEIIGLDMKTKAIPVVIQSVERKIPFRITAESLHRFLENN